VLIKKDGYAEATELAISVCPADAVGMSGALKLFLAICEIVLAHI
jgi:hypothetical protein